MPGPTQPKKKKKYDDWEIESAASTLVEAEKIKRDKPMMKYVKVELKKRQVAMQAAAKSILNK